VFLLLREINFPGRRWPEKIGRTQKGPFPGDGTLREKDLNPAASLPGWWSAAIESHGLVHHVRVAPYRRRHSPSLMMRPKGEPGLVAGGDHSPKLGMRCPESKKFCRHHPELYLLGFASPA